MEKRKVCQATSPFQPGVPHIAEQIFGYLSGGDLKTCRLVSKEWNHAASRYLWEKTEIEGIRRSTQNAIDLIKNASSEECRFSFNLSNVGPQKFQCGSPRFLLKPSVVNFVAAVKLDIYCVGTIKELLTSLPNLKMLSATVDVTRKLQKERPSSENASGVRSLELQLVRTRRGCVHPGRDHLRSILQTCGNLKELVLSDDASRSIDIDEIYKALPCPGNLNRLKLSLYNTFEAIPKADFVSLQQFTNLHDLDLLNWGRISIEECATDIGGIQLPATLRSLKWKFYFDEIPKRLILPTIMKSTGLTLGSCLKELVLRAEPEVANDPDKIWVEEWRGVEGKLELREAKVVSLCHYTEDMLNLMECKRLERLAWHVSWGSLLGAMRLSTPPCVKQMKICLLLDRADDVHEVMKLRKRHFNTITDLETVEILFYGPLQRHSSRMLLKRQELSFSR